MAETYTKEQLNQMDRKEHTALTLSLQERLVLVEEKNKKLDRTLQLIMEELSDARRRRFGRSSEKLDDLDGQLVFQETEDGIVFFNESEVIADAEDDEDDDEPEEEDTEPPKKRGKKRKGKRMEDIKGLPVKKVFHDMSEEELNDVFGDEEYKRLPDEIEREYYFKPAEIGVTEHHIAVYSGRISEDMVKADHPKKLIRNSLASPSLIAGIATAKYVNGVPLCRQETELNNKGISITRANMANWIIHVSKNHLQPLYFRMKASLLGYHVIQADETPVLVNKDGRPAGSKSYMWVYRTGVMSTSCPVILYEYQKTRKADHPREFLKGFSGVCTTDGYQVYHTVEGELEDLIIAGCYAHARRKYDEALKALPKKKRKGAYAYTALKLIQAIYNADRALSDLSVEERLKQRQESVAPLVDAYFDWVKTNIGKVLNGSKTYKAMQYSINQEKYLRVFLSDGEVAMDNNGALSEGITYPHLFKEMRIITRVAEKSVA